MWIAILILAAALNGPAARKTPVLWSEPKPAGPAEWIWGPGGEAKAPRPPFRFIRENMGGTNPKVDVRDARGTLWIVKFGGEVHTETFAARFLNAVGYLAEPTYFVPAGVIEGAHGLTRAKPFIGRDGSFRWARFRIRDPKELAYDDEIQWSWQRNPFLGTHELAGLKILLMLLSNWDAKDSRDGKGSNTAVFEKPAAEDPAYFYAFNDWGASLGRWGGFLNRDRWDPAAYERQTRRFARLDRSGAIVWGFHGKHNRDLTRGISVEDVCWLVRRLEGVDREDLRLGLLASGATARDADALAGSVSTRIHQLEWIAASSQGEMK